MLSKLFRTLWGDLTREEYKKFSILSVAMMLIIGNFWMLRVTKDAIFNQFVGYTMWEPTAKIVSAIVMIFVVLGYSKLVDIFRRHQLIYLLCSFYGITLILLSFLLSKPNLTIINQTSFIYPLVSWIPGKGLGWFAYLFLESYGSLLIGLFYSFIASVMTTDLAKKGYGFMFVFIQMATVIGVLVEIFFVKKIGFPPFYFIGGILVLLAPFVIKIYMKTFAEEIEAIRKADHAKNKKTGFLEGAKLVLTRPYIMGIFVVASFYEIISTIIEYQMGNAALSVYVSQHSAFAVFKGYQGLGINLLSFTFAFMGGTSIFMRKFGLKFCLIAFPLTIGAVVCLSYGAHLTGISNYYLMWILLIASMIIKGLNYALNKPTSEVTYIPTSKDVKFKAKGWVDMFGLRSTKAVGGWINNVAPLMLYGTIISLGVVGVWVFVAGFVGNKFEELQKENKIVE